MNEKTLTNSIWHLKRDERMLQDSHRIYPVCDEICLVSLQSSWHSIVQISGSSWTVCSTFSPHTHFFQNVGPNQAIRNWTNIRTTHELYERDFKIAFQNRYRLITWFRISLRNQQSSRRKKLYLFSHNKGMVRLKIYNTRKLASNKKWIVKVAWSMEPLWLEKDFSGNKDLIDKFRCFPGYFDGKHRKLSMKSEIISNTSQWGILFLKKSRR